MCVSQSLSSIHEMVKCVASRKGIKSELEGPGLIHAAHVLLEQRAVTLLLQAIPDRLQTEIVSYDILQSADGIPARWRKRAQYNAELFGATKPQLLRQ